MTHLPHGFCDPSYPSYPYPPLPLPFVHGYGYTRVRVRVSFFYPRVTRVIHYLHLRQIEMGLVSVNGGCIEFSHSTRLSNITRDWQYTQLFPCWKIKTSIYPACDINGIHENTLLVQEDQPLLEVICSPNCKVASVRRKRVGKGFPLQEAYHVNPR